MIEAVRGQDPKSLDLKATGMMSINDLKGDNDDETLEPE